MVRSGRHLEPVVIHQLATDRRSVKIRILLRKDRKLGNKPARPNELVYTNIIETIPSTRIARPCYIRIYPETDVCHGHIPSPYSLNGVGDYWILTCQMSASGEIESLDKAASFGFH